MRNFARPHVQSKNRPLLGVCLIFLLCTISFSTKLIARHGLTPNELSDPYRLVLQIEWAVILSAAVITVTLYIDRLALSSIGMRRPGGRDITAGLFFLVVGFAIEGCIRPAIAVSGLTGIHIRTWELPPILEWTSIIAAALGEELVFRGYLIERIEALTGGTATAIALSSLLFALWHLPMWGAGGTIVPGAWGILLALLYVWRRNLTACMFTHFLADAIASRDIAFSLTHSRWGYLEFAIYFRLFRN